MKYLVCILLLLPGFAYAQKYDDRLLDFDGYTEWTPADFMAHGVKKIEAHYYSITPGGKARTNDSTLLFRMQVDIDGNKVSGVDARLSFAPRGPAYRGLHTFATYYNAQGQVSARAVLYVADKPRKNHGTLEYDQTGFRIDDVCDSAGRLLRETETSYMYEYTLRRHGRHTDTSAVMMTAADPYEYVYDSVGNLREQYRNPGYGVYHITEAHGPSTDSLSTDDTVPRYRVARHRYGENGKPATSARYTHSGTVYLRTDYVYEGDGRLLQQTDSTGWHSGFLYPKRVTVITYAYTADGVTETRTHNPENGFSAALPTSIKRFDTQGRLLQECTVNPVNNTQNCSTYTYTADIAGYNRQTLMESKDVTRLSRYVYGPGNLLLQELHYTNGVLTGWMRYRYE